MTRSPRCGCATPPNATTSRRSSSSPTTPASSRIATARRCGRTSAGAGATAPVVDVYRTSLRIGFEEGIRRVLGISTDSLSKDWISATRRAYLPVLEGRTRPNGAGEAILQTGRKTGDMNLAPTVSPDGKLVAFFARRSLFEIELFVADAQTGRVIKKLAGPTSDSHFDAISFISTSGAWSPDNAKFAFVAQAEGNHEIAILDVNSGNIERRIRVPGVGSVSHIAWSPDGQTIAFSGMAGGISDLYLLDLAAGTVRQLTNDRNADLQPAWSPDGKTLAFSTDRGTTTDFKKMIFSPLQLATSTWRPGRSACSAHSRTGSTSTRSTRPTGRASSSSAIRTASATSTGSRSPAAGGRA